MALRNAKRFTTTRWRGHNTFTPKENTDDKTWIDSNNVLVNARGEAEPLRSPKAFGSTVGGSGTLYGLSEFARASNYSVLIIDRGTASYYLTESAGSPTSWRTGQAGNPWSSLTINDRYFRCDGAEFIQLMNNLSSVYRVGIDPPAAAPTIAYTTNLGSADVDIAVSYQGSYCYRNSTTGHVSAPSPLSNVLTAATGENSISWAVVASTQTGVDQIIFFLTVDGGAIPYLVISCTDASIISVSNATATVYTHIADVTRDTLTPEPIYNNVPPVSARGLFTWKDRIFAIVDGGLRFSGYETCYIGKPGESWPTLNQLNVPNKSNPAIGGISTQVGALIFGSSDSYLLSGYPSDKASSPNNQIALTEHLDPLNWSLGIKYLKTAVNTPYGVIWTDQNTRIYNWSTVGLPTEIGEPLRAELDTMTGTLSASWFQHGKNGGYYVLTNGTKTVFVLLYKPETELLIGYGKTDLSIDAISSVLFATPRFFFAKTNRVYELLDPTLQGDGWAGGTNIFFKIMLGNQMNFSNLHSMQLDGTLSDLVVTVTDSAGSDSQTVTLASDADTGGAKFGIIDSPQRRRHIVAFTFNTTDTANRNIKASQIFYQDQDRVI